jgi:hypothetical protein
MSTGDAVAVYAACVASAALAWQVVAWRRARATDVRVLLAGGMFGAVAEPVLVVRNHSAHEVQIRTVGIQPARLSPWRQYGEPPTDLLDFELEGGCPQAYRDPSAARSWSSTPPGPTGCCGPESAIG